MKIIMKMTKSKYSDNPLVEEGQRLWKETQYRRDYAKAFRLFSEAAEQGYVPAFWEMGNAYREGLGVERDFNEAAAWFERGMQAGDSSCMTFLGLMHFRGEGMAEDGEAAAGLWREAADLDNSDAMFYLGVCCEKGLAGMKRSGRKAVEWYRMSDYHGSACACESLAALYRRKPLLKVCIKTKEKVEQYKCGMRQNSSCEPI